MIDTTKILPGQEFKNMQELSVALTGQKMPAGNRYVVRVNEMKKYLSWDKVPGSNRIIITDIFPEPVTKPRKKCKKRIATPREYYPQGKYNSMIYANLTTLELNHKYSLSELFEELGMTSCRFTRPKYYLDCVNTTNLSLSTYRYFFNKLNNLLSKTLYTTLTNFKKRECISYHMEYRYTFKQGYEEIDIPTEAIEVGLGNVDNTADATKSVKYAISAGSASSATALTSNAGSSTQPVYFSGGKPVACSYTLGKSVPADALFTDHTYGNMKGATSSSAGSAGLVPAPNIGEQLKFLRADGAWVIPTNTTYSVGTSSYLGITKLYTETGSATDGTMTQNAITTALNGKSATGHTHNYAGSSSAGGNANAAVKLATARKIGSASFDGTADITLSQMGLNVPVEITKADYLAKKKAGTLNANTYYNVIDEYDSVNVINDSSVTANSTFSSTKSEKTYAKKSTLVNTTLTASKWTGSSAPYSYVLSVSGVTSSNIVEIDYASNASSAAIEAYQNAMLADGGQTTNQITIKATEKPTVDIPITIVIRNDL